MHGSHDLKGISEIAFKCPFLCTNNNEFEYHISLVPVWICTTLPDSSYTFSPIRKVHLSSALKFNALWHFFFPISLFNTWRLWVYPCQMFIFGIPITTAQEVLTEWLIKTITIIILSKYLVSNVFFLCYDSSVKSLVHKCFKFALCMFETRENNTKTRLYK